MEHRFNILIEGQVVHKAVTQEMFFDIMEDLSNAYYETGFPDPKTISHTIHKAED